MLNFLAIPVATFLVGVMLGFITGWLSHKQVSKKEIMNWERSLITVIVTFVWSVSLIFDILIIGYETPIAVHAVMGLVAGYFFEGSIVDFIKRK